MVKPDPEGDDLVPLSALNALLYCDRRAALRHLDGLYVHNEHTRRGDSLHKRADTPGFEKRKGVRTERGLWIASRRFGSSAAPISSSSGASREDGGGASRSSRSRCPSSTNAARNVGGTTTKSSSAPRPSASKKCSRRPFPRGAIYHEQSKSRREVEFTPELRAVTESAVAQLHALLASGRIPPGRSQATVPRVLPPRSLPARSLRQPRQDLQTYLRELFHAE